MVGLALLICISLDSVVMASVCTKVTCDGAMIANNVAVITIHLVVIALDLAVVAIHRVSIPHHPYVVSIHDATRCVARLHGERVAFAAAADVIIYSKKKKNLDLEKKYKSNKTQKNVVASGLGDRQRV
jgi:hypothetical protein